MEHLMHVGNPHHFTYIVSSNSQNITAAMCVYPHFIKGVKQDSVSPPVSGSQHLNPGMLDFRATFTFIQQLLIDFPFYVRHCLHHICLFNLLFNLIYLFGAFKKIGSPLENKASCRIPCEFRRKQYSESLEVSCLKEGERGKKIKMLPRKYPLVAPSHLLWASGAASRASECIYKHFAPVTQDAGNVDWLHGGELGKEGRVGERKIFTMNSLVPSWNHVNIIPFQKKRTLSLKRPPQVI